MPKHQQYSLHASQHTPTHLGMMAGTGCTIHSGESTRRLLMSSTRQHCTAPTLKLCNALAQSVVKVQMVALAAVRNPTQLRHSLAGTGSTTH